MAENENPLGFFNVNHIQFYTQYGNVFRAWRSIGPAACEQTVSTSMDITTSHPARKFESCRFRSTRVHSDTTFCEIVQKKAATSFIYRQSENVHRHLDRPSALYQRPFRSHFLCRKRLQKSQFCSRRHRYVPRYAESRDFRRRRHTTLAQRRAANVREQKRMMNLKEAFRALRECLPTLSYEKKLSRIDTLRLAILYINFLKQLTDGKHPDEAEWAEAKS